MNLEKIPGSSLNLWELSFGYNLTRNEFIHAGAGSPGIEMIEECGETGETAQIPGGWKDRCHCEGKGRTLSICDTRMRNFPYLGSQTIRAKISLTRNLEYY